MSELRARLGLIKRAEARLAAMKTAALAEYASRGGEGLARRVALDELQASKQQARREDFGTFSRTLRDHQHEQSADDGKSLFAKKRERRSLNFFKSPDDGMFILNGRFDNRHALSGV